MSKIIMEQVAVEGAQGTVLFPKYTRNAHGQIMVLMGSIGWENPQPQYKAVKGSFGFGFHFVQTCSHCHYSDLDGHLHVAACTLHDHLPAHDSMVCDDWKEPEFEGDEEP